MKKVLTIVALSLVMSLVLAGTVFAGGGQEKGTAGEKTSEMKKNLVIGKIPITMEANYHQAHVKHLIAYAKEKGVGLLRLETGIHQGAAIGLYERFGFESIGPFGGYKDDPLSRFYEKRLGVLP